MAEDIRDAFFETLYEIALKDRNVILLSDDQGAFPLTKFKEKLRRQYFNVGIAEQNLISMAAGLALEGKKPFLYGISPFMTARCYEQIRLDVSCMNLPVTIVGSGAGLTYGSDGPTHHATQDVAIMRVLPGMMILNPADASATRATAQIAYQSEGPKYIRIEKGVLPAIYEQGHDFSKGFEVLKPGNDLMIITTGFLVHQALQLAHSLAKNSLDIGVLDLYRIKPVNLELLSALNSVKKILTFEEHSLIGGIGSLISELLTDSGKVFSLKRIGLPDRHSYEYGNREWMQEKLGLGLDAVCKEILAWFENVPG